VMSAAATFGLGRYCFCTIRRCLCIRRGLLDLRCRSLSRSCCLLSVGRCRLCASGRCVRLLCGVLRLLSRIRL
jgi:hypothetical protein